MKKLAISIFSVIILITLIFGTKVYASSLSLSTSKSEVTVGDTVTVTVSFGQKVTSADVTLTFDSSKFTYSSVSAGTPNNSGSSITVSYYDSTGGSSPISSMTFTFTSKATGTGTFTAKCSSASDTDINSVTISGTPSKTVTVNEKATTTTTTTNTTTTNTTTKSTTNTTKTTTVTKSSNANLSSIEIEGFSLTPEFSTETTTYYLAVNQDISSLNITANVEDTKASTEISGNTDLQFGTSTITIKVTAEDGTTKEYLIEVNKEDTSIGLSSLLISIDGEYLSYSPEFDKNTLEYTVYTEDASSIVVEAESNYEEATVTIVGADELESGKNTVKITVQKDEEIKEYTITVNNTITTHTFSENFQIFMNSYGSMIVIICMLIQTAIAIFFAVIAYKLSNSRE